MNTQSAIHIAQEEAVRLERLAGDMQYSDMRDRQAAAEWAESARERAEAMRVLIRIAQAFDAAGRE